MNDSSNKVEDVGQFFTGMLVTSGLCLPLVLYHCQLINHYSCIMSTVGGLIIYSSIVVFTWFFNNNTEDEEDGLFGY